MPIYRLNERLVFPPPELSQEGLLAVGGDLRIERLLLAYRMGIFPWYSEGEPILWWSPDPRMILFPEQFHISRSLRRVLKKGMFRVTLDTAFEDVIAGCAAASRPGREATWITPEMARAYTALYEEGYAHSVECWEGDALAGGVYGVSLGACFFGESMFTRVSNASKVALAMLTQQLIRWNFMLIDCQVANAHLERLGAREVPRSAFLALLRKALQAETRRGRWRWEDGGSRNSGDT